MKRLPFEHRFCVVHLETVDYSPRHSLAVPGLDVESRYSFETTYSNEQMFVTREQALRSVAEENATTIEDWIYATHWAVVIEFLPQPAQWYANIREDGFSPHSIPFRIVKPTKAERALYGKPRRVAVAS